MSRFEALRLLRVETSSPRPLLRAGSVFAVAWRLLSDLRRVREEDILRGGEREREKGIEVEGVRECEYIGGRLVLDEEQRLLVSVEFLEAKSVEEERRNGAEYIISSASHFR